jgi:hypothetical protein
MKVIIFTYVKEGKGTSDQNYYILQAYLTTFFNCEAQNCDKI